MSAVAWNLCRVIATKPSGLTLIQLGCGCAQWARRKPDGSIHYGRRAAYCGRPLAKPDGPAECVSASTQGFAVRFAKAVEFVFSEKGRAAIEAAK